MLWALVTLALSAAAPLDEDIDFVEGKRLIEELDYERAVFRFQKLARSDRPAEERATVNAWLGLTYANLGDEPEAIKAFVVALKLDPLVVLPPSSPKVAQTFDKARKIARDELRADADADGIVDASDGCPAEPETKNGFDDDDGCPDAVPVIKAVEPPVEPPVDVVVPAPTDSDGDGFDDGSDGCPSVAGEVGGCPPVTEPTAVKGPPALLIGGATALGLGVVGFGVGGLSGALAQQSQEQALAAVFQDDRQALKADADGLATAANVAFVVGGALVVTGAVLLGLSLVGGDA